MEQSLSSIPSMFVSGAMGELNYLNYFYTPLKKNNLNTMHALLISNALFGRLNKKKNTKNIIKLFFN